MSERGVADATVPIYLARLDRLPLLDELFESVLVPEAVYEEVVETGREEGYGDALAVDDAIEAFLPLRSLSGEAGRRAEDVREAADLGPGEAEAIALALESDARCLTDDHAARTTAGALGVPVGGTIYVLLEGLDAGELTREAYVDALEPLDESGFRMSARLYRRAVEAGVEIAGDSRNGDG